MAHWFHFPLDWDYSKSCEVYFSIGINLKNGEVKLFFNSNGKSENISTVCSTDYLKDSELLDKDVPLCSGVHVDNSGASFQKFDIFAVRIYNKVLEDKEIEDNFHESINYKNYLEKNI